MLERIFKKLDLLIIKAFVGPFIAIFFITLFVLVLQFMWLYIDDMVGKGLDTVTIIKLIVYLSATLVPLALPLAVLLSSIMTLGSLGETYELVAIKSAGISLLRFMRPLFFVSLVLTFVAFYFNNNILPVATLKMNTIKYDIIVTKPAFDIKEGVFYDRIEGFVIKIGKKEQNGPEIRDVVIYEQSGGQTDNIIIADSGRMFVTPDKQALEFVLKSGTRIQERNTSAPNGTELVRMSFKTYKKVMDLSSFKMNKTEDSTFRHNPQMQTLPQLSHTIDSIGKINAAYIAKARKGVNAYMKFPSYLDTSGWGAIEKDTAHSRYLMPVARAADSIKKAWTTARHSRDSVDKAQDSIRRAEEALVRLQASKPSKPGGVASTGAPNSNGAKAPAISPGHPATPIAAAPTATAPTAAAAGTPPSKIPIPGGAAMNDLAGMKHPPAPTLSDLIPDSARNTVMDRAITALNSAKISLDQPVMLYNNEEKNLLQNEIQWHDKITMAIAVMVMFLIGAPLGSIIRKGGIGLPLVFAVVFFVIFFLLRNFGKKFVEQSVMSPIGGIWMPTYVLTPIGIFLTYKAMHDSQLFNKEFYFRISRKVRSLIQQLRNWKKASKISGSNVG